MPPLLNRIEVKEVDLPSRTISKVILLGRINIRRE